MKKGGMGMGMWAVTFDRLKQEYSLLQGMYDSLQVYCRQVPTNIEETFVEDEFVKFNLISNSIHLNVNHLNKHQANKLKIIDISGKSVLERTNITSQIDVSALTLGLYFVQVLNDNILLRTEKIYKR